ncbi:ALQxL family class IV lanthipeptide [Pedobacter mucosus]
MSFDVNALEMLSSSFTKDLPSTHKI